MYDSWRRYDDDYARHEGLKRASLPIALLLLPATMRTRLRLLAARAEHVRRNAAG